jgi:tellurite resistance protein TehA-like permease
VLFAISVACYCWLLAATILRICRARSAIWADLLNPRQVFAFFTLVAATDVLGVGIMLRGWAALAAAMWLAVFALWLVLIYAGFAVFAFLNTGREADLIHGGWLIAIVGTESLVIAGTLLARLSDAPEPLIFLMTYMLWGIGLVLYAIYFTLFAHRIFFLAFEPDDVTPLLWVVMGAAAIIANAGTALIASGGEPAFLRNMEGFIDSVALIAWTWAAWLTPLMAFMGIWKHGVRRVPILYTPALWALVFPLGMFSVASFRLSPVTGMPELRAISVGMAWIAFGAWSATGIGLLMALRKDYRDFRRTDA